LTKPFGCANPAHAFGIRAHGCEFTTLLDAVTEELPRRATRQPAAGIVSPRNDPIDDLPRTRNLKIMRRVLRAVFERKDPGDLSALANPEAVERLREKLEKEMNR
jgi:acyl-coenzyme A synthetase/AMP-(fatty) acid ligase